jgi:hypothetical protein
LDLLHSPALLQEERHPQCPQQHQVFSAAPMDLSFKSGAATVTAVVMGGVVTAVAAIITVGAEAVVTTMVGGIIAIGGDLQSLAISRRPPSVRRPPSSHLQRKTRRHEPAAPILSLSGCD